MAYFWVKWVHVIASTVLFGTGLGIAFFMWIAHRRGDPRVIAETARTVVLADTVFTAPAVLLQVATGLWLANMLGLPLTSDWVGAALLLFALVGCCWLPVLVLQMRARDMALAAVESGGALPPAYHRVMRWWFWLGWPAFLSVLAIFWLMVWKPAMVL